MRIDSPDRHAPVAAIEIHQRTTDKICDLEAPVLDCAAAITFVFDDGLIRKSLCMFFAHALIPVPAERWIRDIAHRTTSYSEASRFPE